MLRRIWHRAATLALPVTLAICLPPLAVIAFNLHAESSPAHSRASARSYAAASKVKKIEHSANLGQRHLNRKPQSVQRDQIASARN